MRALIAAVVAALALTAVPVDTAAATPDPVSAAAAGSAAAPGATEPRRHADLRRDYRPARPSGMAWPRGVIRYYETLPAKWQWGLDRAIEHWNTTGAKVRFVKVGNKKKAQVTIGYGKTYGADGLGGWSGIGRKITKGFVHINPGYKKVDEKDDTQRVWMGRLIAHELGHVLSYEHTPGECSLMTPIFFFDTCELLSVDKPGYYACRWIDTALLQAHIKKYGGKAKRPGQDCLVYPLPDPLQGVRFSGGSGTTPASISWTRLARPRPLEKILVDVWSVNGTCAGAPDGVDAYVLPVTATSWVDPEEGSGGYCFRVRSVNHSGIGGAGATQLLQRVNVPPAKPVISGITYQPAEGRFVFAANVGANHTMYYVRGSSLGDATTCPTSVDVQGSSEIAYDIGPGIFEFYPSAAQECVTFVVTNAFGKVSPLTSAVFTVPPPAATAPSASVPVWDDDYSSWVTTATAPGGAAVSFDVRPGACPGTLPSDLTFESGYGIDESRYALSVYDEGVTCLFAAVVDAYGRRSSVAKVQWTVNRLF